MACRSSTYLCCSAILGWWQATHSVRPDSPNGSVPDVTKATTDPVGHPWAPGRPIVTLIVIVVLFGRIAVIPVLVPDCIQTQYCSCWESAEHGLECYIKDSTC